MKVPSIATRTARRTAVAAAAVAVALTASSAAVAATSSHAGVVAPKPTVVLVHGAWADSGSWDDVVRQLQHDGYPVDVFPTPLRRLATDSAALREYLDAIAGPIVLVGHSYGGAVVTDAATGDANIRALVYLDAFAPAQGESVIQLAGASSALANPDFTKVFNLVPAGSPTDSTDLYVRPDVFQSAFANDIAPVEGRVLAATQRPIAFGALTDASSTPAWLTIPSWYEIGTIDQVIPPAQQQMMAQRADAHITSIRSSHLPMASHPDSVRSIIEQAARATT